MKKSNRRGKGYALLFGLLLTSQAYADFQVDANFAAVPGAQYNANDGLHTTWSQQGIVILADTRDKLVEAGGNSLGLSSYDASAHLLWNGSSYYITGRDYITKASNDEYKKSVIEKRKERLFANAGVCELFLYDAHLNLLSRYRVQLPMDNGGPFCNGSLAIGRAQPGEAALLYSVSYYEVGTPKAKRIADIGNNWHYSSYLIRLNQQANGSIQMSQDDSCLGRKNNYATIVQARKALKRCAALRLSPGGETE